MSLSRSQICCVQGCPNSNINEKESDNHGVQFYEFPAELESRNRLLQAIGCPDWVPPLNAYICNAHFICEEYKADTHETEDHHLYNYNIPQIDYQASDLEVCRICLATDVKMHKFGGMLLKTVLTLSGSDQAVEGLPQFICFECANIVIKCINLTEKSLVAQTTLLEIYSECGQITKELVQSINRDMLSLSSSLAICEPSKVIIVKHESNGNSYDDNCEHACVKEYTDHYESSDDKEFDDIYYDHIDDESIDIRKDITFTKIDDAASRCASNCDIKSEKTNNNKTSDYYLFYIGDDKNRDESENATIQMLEKEKDDIEDYFNILQLSSEEQVEDWKEMMVGENKNYVFVFECLVCAKLFSQPEMFQKHIFNHNQDQVDEQCGVCGLLFKKNDVLLHIQITHSKKFLCMECPKVFNNIRLAKKHYLWHNEERNMQCKLSVQHTSPLRCKRCGRFFVSLMGLRQHIHHSHAKIPEFNANESLHCKSCNILFSTINAKRLHILNSLAHKNNAGLLGPTSKDLKTTCRKCGELFPTVSQLVEHMMKDHKEKYVVNKDYPSACEHCGEMIPTRRQHYWHYLRNHPTETYQPVITSFCKLCGKGFQNPAKLQIHELRHGQPLLSCTLCPRRFYDKYALTRHMSLHSSLRPFKCEMCGLAFKQKGNLDRHAKVVHSELRKVQCSMCDKRFKYTTSLNLHVRTIHYNMPHPPRKKRLTRDTLAETKPERRHSDVELPMVNTDHELVDENTIEYIEELEIDAM